MLAQGRLVREPLIARTTVAWLSFRVPSHVLRVIRLIEELGVAQRAHQVRLPRVDRHVVGQSGLVGEARLAFAALEPLVEQVQARVEGAMRGREEALIALAAPVAALGHAVVAHVVGQLGFLQEHLGAHLADEGFVREVSLEVVPQRTHANESPLALDALEKPVSHVVALRADVLVQRDGVEEQAIALRAADGVFVQVFLRHVLKQAVFPLVRLAALGALQAVRVDVRVVLQLLFEIKPLLTLRAVEGQTGRVPRLQRFGRVSGGRHRRATGGCLRRVGLLALAILRILLQTWNKFHTL